MLEYINDMKSYKGQELGPIMESDALVLQAIIKATCPKVVVEFGHYWGESARKMLEVMDHDAVLYSFDNTKDNSVAYDARCIFFLESQEDIGKHDEIDNIDFVFMDASHEFGLNKETFLALLPKLSSTAVLVIHDTGAWSKGNVFDINHGHETDKGWVHRPDEQEFVDWIKNYCPDFQLIHLHSAREVRHGLTVIQKYYNLT